MKVRLPYFDVLRAIAIIGVVTIHVIGIGYTNEKFSINYNLSIVLRQLVNFSVPLFLFISGYFMSKVILKSKNDYFSYLKKQIPRVLIPFIVWSVIYSFLAYLNGRGTMLIIKEFLHFEQLPPFISFC